MNAHDAPGLPGYNGVLGDQDDRDTGPPVEILEPAKGFLVLPQRLLRQLAFDGFLFTYSVNPFEINSLRIP